MAEEVGRRYHAVSGSGAKKSIGGDDTMAVRPVNLDNISLDPNTDPSLITMTENPLGEGEKPNPKGHGIADVYKEEGDGRFEVSNPLNRCGTDKTSTDETRTTSQTGQRGPTGPTKRWKAVMPHKDPKSLPYVKHVEQFSNISLDKPLDNSSFRKPDLTLSRRASWAEKKEAKDNVSKPSYTTIG